MFLMAALAIRGFFTNRKTKKNAGAAVKQDTTHFLGEQQMVRIKLVQKAKHVSQIESQIHLLCRAPSSSA